MQQKSNKIDQSQLTVVTFDLLEVNCCFLRRKWMEAKNITWATNYAWAEFTWSRVFDSHYKTVAPFEIFIYRFLYFCGSWFGKKWKALSNSPSKIILPVVYITCTKNHEKLIYFSCSNFPELHFINCVLFVHEENKTC